MDCEERCIRKASRPASRRVGSPKVVARPKGVRPHDERAATYLLVYRTRLPHVHRVAFGRRTSHGLSVVTHPALPDTHSAISCRGASTLTDVRAESPARISIKRNSTFGIAVPGYEKKKEE